MEYGQVIIYTLGQLIHREKNYPTHDLELSTETFTLKIWMHYLLGDGVEIYMDHKSLNYVFTFRKLNVSA